MPILVMEDGSYHYESERAASFPEYRNSHLVNKYKDFLMDDVEEMSEWQDVTVPSFWDTNSPSPSQNDGMIWTGVDWIIRPYVAGLGQGGYLRVRDTWAKTGWIYGWRITFTCNQRVQLYITHNYDTLSNGYVSSGIHYPMYVASWNGGKEVTSISFNSNEGTGPYTLHITKIEIRKIPYRTNIATPEEKMFVHNPSSDTFMMHRINYVSNSFIQLCYAGLNNNYYHVMFDGLTQVTEHFQDATAYYDMCPVKVGSDPGFIFVEYTETEPEVGDYVLCLKYKNGETWVREALYTYSYNPSIKFYGVDSVGTIHVLILQYGPYAIYHYSRPSGGSWSRELASSVGSPVFGSNTAWGYIDSSDKLHLCFWEYSSGYKTSYLTNASGSWIKEFAVSDSSALDAVGFFSGRSAYPTLLCQDTVTGDTYIYEKSGGSWQTRKNLFKSVTVVPCGRFQNGFYQILCPYDELIEEIVVDASDWSYETYHMFKPGHINKYVDLSSYFLTDRIVLALPMIRYDTVNQEDLIDLTVYRRQF
jgi:hypothetical protein